MHGLPLTVSLMPHASMPKNPAESLLVAGLDEVGRGPLAGPVVTAAVILDPQRRIHGLADSKVLSPSRRQVLATEIESKAIAWSIAWADPAEIDGLNILWATMLAMRRAVLGLRVQPDLLLVDGNRVPDTAFYGRSIDAVAVVGGDAMKASISAASIVAKVYRDNMMLRIDALYPQYGFRRHKGYGTVLHRERLDDLGPCPQHRCSFKPVAEATRSV